ncbi:hypothetical protein B9T34_00495 [Acinetobacter sp. ANC 3813]|nr:hypothetical protein B9T34_00495 [Acinetobacter sp. ANC 3813]
MKVFVQSAVFVGALMSLSHAAAGQTAMQKMLKPYIEQQCASELKDSNMWKASTFLMTDSNTSQFAKDVCGCVSTNALNDVPATELAHAAVSSDAKNLLIKKAMMNTLKSCVVQQKM